VCRNERIDNVATTSSTTSRPACNTDLMKGLSPISSTNPDFTAQRRPAGPVSRKSASSDCVKGHEVTGSQGQEEFKAAVRLVKSENGTFSDRTSRRPSRRKRSRYCHCGPRRHLVTSSNQRHVTESPTMTSSAVPRVSPPMTSPGTPRESPPVTSSTGNPHTPRGRTSCKRNRRGTESPTVTSSGKPREDSAARIPDPRCYVRSTSVPPPATLAPINPFSPLWNFLFNERGSTASSVEDDHVCNTVQRPRDSWFGSSAIITNVYLSTVNR